MTHASSWPNLTASTNARRVLPDGPERLGLMHKANHLMLAYMPYHPHNYPLRVDMLQKEVRGYVRHPFNRDRWRFVDMG